MKEPNKVLKIIDRAIAQSLSLTAEALRTSKDNVRYKMIKALKNYIVRYSASSNPTWSLSYLMTPSNPNAFVRFQ